MGERVKIFFDGGCRPNPGTMELALVSRGKTRIVRDLGYGTSMQAEWLALIAALRLAHAQDLGNFVLLGDAVAVIDQASGRTRARAAHADHLATFRALAADGPPPGIRHVKRSQNLAGIALARVHDRKSTELPLDTRVILRLGSGDG